MATMTCLGSLGMQTIQASHTPAAPTCLPGGPVTTIVSIDVCTGTTTVDIPVQVSSFNEVGSMSLTFGYNPAQLTNPEITSVNAAFDEKWTTFTGSMNPDGSYKVSAFGANPTDGVSLDNGSTIFALRFTILSGPASVNITFVENIQGTACEFTGVAPSYSPYCDTPTVSFYNPGILTIYPQLPSGTAPTVADLQATGENIKWYANETSDTELVASTELINGTDYWASQTINGCESTARLKVTAYVDPTPCAPTGEPAQSFCSADAPAVGDLAATGDNIHWYTAATGGTPLAPTVLLETATDYWATQTINCIESAGRLKVTVTITDCP